MDEVLLAGRILFALPFLMFGLNHLAKREGMTGYAEFKGVPLPGASVVISGIVLILGALSVIVGVYGDVGAIALGAMAALTAVLMHDFWSAEGEEQQNEMVQFMKNVGLIGGAVILFAIFATFGESLDYTVTESVFTLD